MSKIAVIGAQNSGKTTLSKVLIEGFPMLTSITEVVRTLVKEKNISINKTGDFDSQLAVFLAHYNNLQKSDSILTDRSVIDAYAYTVYNKHQFTKNQLDLFKALYIELLDQYDGFIYLYPVEMVDDNFRDTDVSFQHEIHAIFLKLLKNPKIHSKVLILKDKSFDARLEKSRIFIENLIDAGK